MARTSAGLLLHRLAGRGVEVFLVHPGGPFWARRDAGAWSIPKGEIDAGEDALGAARREFREETGLEPPEGEAVALDAVRQSGGKVVLAFAVAGDCDADAIESGTFTMQWPPRSGREQAFPEVDRAGWFTLEEAAEKLVPGQVALLAQLEALLGAR